MDALDRRHQILSFEECDQSLRMGRSIYWSPKIINDLHKIGNAALIKQYIRDLFLPQYENLRSNQIGNRKWIYTNTNAKKY